MARVVVHSTQSVSIGANLEKGLYALFLFSSDSQRTNTVLSRQLSATYGTLKMKEARIPGEVKHQLPTSEGGSIGLC